MSPPLPAPTTSTGRLRGGAVHLDNPGSADGYPSPAHGQGVRKGSAILLPA